MEILSREITPEKLTVSMDIRSSAGILRTLNQQESAVAENALSAGLEITVPPTLPANCKIMFVGEAGGADEVSAGEGFVGPAGRCLQKACRVAGLDWALLGRSNVAKRRPFADSDDFRKAFYEIVEEPVYTPKGNLSKRTRKVTHKTQELLQWEDQLEQELRRHNPNLVLAAGNIALETLTGLGGITNYRGSVVESRWFRSDGTPFKVLATFHPSYIIQGGIDEFFILASDLKKAKREIEFPEIRRDPYIEVIQPELSAIQYHLSIIASNPALKYTLDVETRAGTLACFAIGYRQPGTDAMIGFCIPIQLTTGPYWSPEDECAIWEALNATALANPHLINQNLPYDIYYLLRYGIEPSGVYIDTMLLHSLLYPEFPKGLDFLCSFYLDDCVYYKGEGRNWSAGDRDEELWKYNVKDAVYTLRVAEKQEEEARRRGLWEFYRGQMS